MSRAFTLIELIIVVAIIAILAAIALPNFLEAQTRAKVSRAKNDMRTIALAVEAYNTDNGGYPFPLSFFSNPLRSNDALFLIHELTTPVAYLTSVSIADPFPQPDVPPTYWYCNYSGAFIKINPDLGKRRFDGFCLASVGPDHEYNSVVLLPSFIGTKNEGDFLERLYDPTNGTISSGDIARWTGKRSIGN